MLLKDFDKQCESMKAEASREARTAADSIATIYKLEMMKIPLETKTMKWEEYYAEHAGQVLGLSSVVAEAVDDSVMEAVESQVSQIRSVLTTVKKGRKKAQPYSDENQPATSSRTSSRRRVASKTLSDYETPATASRASSRTKSVLETPANSRAPLGALQTPMITPKFDPYSSSLSRTVSRVTKQGEILMSLSGSPVAPSVSNRTKAGKEIASQNALIPLGGGSTLNMPLADDGADMMAVDLDAEQLARLEQLQKNIGNLLRMKMQSGTVDPSTMEN